MNGHRRVKIHAEKRILVLLWAFGFTFSGAIFNGLDKLLKSMGPFPDPSALVVDDRTTNQGTIIPEVDQTAMNIYNL